MNYEFSVSPTDLYSLIESMNAELKLILKDIEKLFEEMIILDSMWEGEASEQFKVQFMKDRESLLVFCDYVQRIIDSMRSSVK